MTEIKNRLNLINGLEQVIYDKDVNAQVKERKHLHKVVAKETGIFGDQYTYGVDDRDDFQEILELNHNSDLQTIPDICLWHQFSMGNAGKENLVIELKKSTVDAGFKEKNSD